MQLSLFSFLILIISSIIIGIGFTICIFAIICDILNNQKLKKVLKQSFEIIINCSGNIDHSNKKQTFKSHLTGLKNIIKYADKKHLKLFIQLGSSLEYGNLISPQKEIKNLNNLNLSLDVNGNRHQTGNTNLMIFDFNYLIEHLSGFITLMPGDIITTGTPPGVGLGMDPPQFLKDGDLMHLKVDHLGEQKSKVVKEV